MLSSECIFVYAAKPTVTAPSTLSFTVPSKGQQVTAGRPILLKGTFQCNPANQDISKIYVWLFLMDTRQGCYYIQRPVSLNKNGTWEATIAFRKDTPRVITVLADASADKLFKSWLAKGTTGKQYELPRSTKFLTAADVKL
jgi:hypothetical protein